MLFTRNVVEHQALHEVINFLDALDRNFASNKNLHKFSAFFNVAFDALEL